MQGVLRHASTHAGIIQCSASDFKTAYSIRLPAGRKGRESLAKLTIYAVAEGGLYAVIYINNSLLDAIEHIADPTRAAVPCRVRVDTTKTVEAALKAIQGNATSTIIFEQTRLRNIGKMSREADIACGHPTSRRNT
ncbi:hypothetical protein CDV55_101532 [Aspergillus turcosus]|nr:hypothetical protein CDV55_101532 [Aspergillus turcosus]